jgi:hypothetical protein
MANEENMLILYSSKYSMLCAEIKMEMLSPIDKGATVIQDKKLTVCAESSS